MNHTHNISSDLCANILKLLHENKDKAVLTLAANVGKSGAEIAERCYPVVYTFLTEGRGLIQKPKAKI